MGQHAVVTGGSRGIGKSIAINLIGFGANVTITGRNEETVTATANEIGAKAIVLDVSDADSIAETFRKLGAVDILVNNAGSVETAPFRHIDLAMWQTTINVNLTGTFLCTKAVLNGMVERSYGRIINIASTAGLKGYPYVAAYCAAKHGVIGMTKALAKEVATKGVTVNAICPGYTDTDMVRDGVNTIMQRTGRSEDEAIAELVKHNPQGRLVKPGEVANTVVWLCNRTSDAINGQAIAIDGGETS